MFLNYGVGWVERSETQLGVRKMLGFVPQPNLQLILILGLKTVPRLARFLIAGSETLPLQLFAYQNE